MKHQNTSKKTIDPLSIQELGIAEYRNVLEKQKTLHQERYEGKIPDTVLVVEHPDVITLGARKNANKLLVSPDILAKKNIDIIDIRRGGGITAHNPGQLVFYPILNLRELNLGVNEYIRNLEAIGIELLRQLGITCQRRKGFPGLWRGHKKIAFVGVQVSRSVTYHGMAINIQNDLTIFDLIIPCGLDDIEMTSVLKETGKKHSMDEVKEKLSEILVEHFGKERKAISHQSSDASNKSKRRLRVMSQG